MKCDQWIVAVAVQWYAQLWQSNIL